MNNNPPLAVAIAAVIKDDKILLQKRTRGDYIGLLALPGGKIKKEEHAAQAALREILEETGIKTEFGRYLGLVSEHLIDDDNIEQHFLLHIFRLNPFSMDFINTEEGDLEWVNLKDVNVRKNELIPSDFEMIDKIILKEKGNYFECIIKKRKIGYVLKKIT